MAGFEAPNDTKNEMVMFFFAKNGFRSTAKSIFEREFPKMAAFIRNVKENDYKRLARQMQIAERKFVIDTVCERLKRLEPEMFMSTIHDSVVAQKSDCDLVLSVMKDEFVRRGVNPRLEWQDVSRHSFSEGGVDEGCLQPDDGGDHYGE